jgi:hypothetical protein
MYPLKVAQSQSQGDVQYHTMPYEKSSTARQRTLALYLALVATLASFAVPAAQLISGQITFKPINITSVSKYSNSTVTHATPTRVHSLEQTNFSGVIARKFESWPQERPLPCFPPEDGWKSVAVQESPSEAGFLYLKPYKTGSSTCAGINLRIARNVARRQESETEICRARFGHGPWKYPALKMFGSRSLERSFLWTVIREPTKRATSMFFHMKVSREKQEPSDDNFRNFLLDDKNNKLDYYIETLSTDRYQRSTGDSPVQFANGILDDYNFIGITERMDESAIAIMMLLDLKMADVMFLSAKNKGSYDDAGYKDRCTYIWKSFVTPGMQEFFQSEAWQRRIQADLALYQAADRSLDMTIDKLGRAAFEANLAKYRHAKEIAHDRCLPGTVFPCNEGGRRTHRNETDCLWKDSGCGTGCLDEISTELGLW